MCRIIRPRGASLQITCASFGAALNRLFSCWEWTLQIGNIGVTATSSHPSRPAPFKTSRSSDFRGAQFRSIFSYFHRIAVLGPPAGRAAKPQASCAQARAAARANIRGFGVLADGPFSKRCAQWFGRRLRTVGIADVPTWSQSVLRSQDVFLGIPPLEVLRLLHTIHGFSQLVDPLDDVVRQLLGRNLAFGRHRSLAV